MEDDQEPESIEKQQLMTPPNQQSIQNENSVYAQRKFPPINSNDGTQNNVIEIVANNKELYENVEEQSYVLLQTETGDQPFLF